MMKYVWLIVFFPFLGFLINGFFGRYFSKRVVATIGASAIGLAFVCGIYTLFDLLSLSPQSRVVEVVFFDWIKTGILNIPAGFLIDPLTMVMVLVVSGVSFLIHIYAGEYMEEDPGYVRFFVYLNLFVSMMLTLVMANNFLLMFVGWEGVGLCSYLLIGFWFEKDSASNAGKKAFIVNRIGDFGFLVAMFIIFTTFHTLNFREVFEKAPEMFTVGSTTITLATLFLFLGATGKSAQIPLYVWLPDAMEGPTPVSALIHAATMVTAGVYMMARCSVLYALAPFSLGVAGTIGALTAVFAASMALVQVDMKRVLAYSTISQIGYMVLGCGVGAFAAGIFHLMTHAFFKALLFLGAGSVSHALAGELDIRKMGGLYKKLPITHITFLSATLAISGIIPFAGFFSKDEILFETFIGHHNILYFLGIAGALMTAFYMFRLYFIAFHGESRVDPEVEKHIHEPSWRMALPLCVLGILSLIGGWIQLPFFHNLKILGGFLEPVFHHAHEIGGIEHGAEAGIWLEGALMALSLVVACIGIYIAYNFYIKKPELPKRLGEKFAGLYRLLFNKYYVDEIYQIIVVKPLYNLSQILSYVVDQNIIDAAVNGTGKTMVYASSTLRRINTGYVQFYGLIMFIGAVVVLLVNIF
ncbi:NADH-quinone oxidoreductase subunit L [Desulfothermus sp.]